MRRRKLSRMVKVVIDSREKVKDKVSSYFKLKGYDVSVEALDAGDFLILGSENFLVERKTASDLAKSIVDTRLWDEIGRLKSVENVKPLLLFEYGKIYGELGLPSIYGALISIVFDFGIPVVSTNSLSQTMLVLDRLCIRAIGKERSRPPIFKPKAENDEDYVLRVVASLPGVGPSKAKMLLAKFETIRRLANASVEELMEVEGIGESTAEKIFKTFNWRWLCTSRHCE